MYGGGRAAPPYLLLLQPAHGRSAAAAAPAHVLPARRRTPACPGSACAQDPRSAPTGAAPRRSWGQREQREQREQRGEGGKNGQDGQDAGQVRVRRATAARSAQAGGRRGVLRRSARWDIAGRRGACRDLSRHRDVSRHRAWGGPGGSRHPRGQRSWAGPYPGLGGSPQAESSPWDRGIRPASPGPRAPSPGLPALWGPSVGRVRGVPGGKARLSRPPSARALAAPASPTPDPFSPRLSPLPQRQLDPVSPHGGSPGTGASPGGHDGCPRWGFVRPNLPGTPVPGAPASLHGCLGVTSPSWGG